MERVGLVILLGVAILLAGCADVPEVTVGQETITVGVTEEAPIRVRIASEPGERFEDIQAHLADSDLIQVLNTTYSKRTIEDDDMAQITFTVLGLQAGEESIPISVDYGEESIETAVRVKITEPDLTLGFADKKNTITIDEQEEFSLQLQNPDDKTYGYVRLHISSDWPAWVELQALPGWPTNSTGDELILPVQVPAKEDRRIPFYVTASPQANAATFTLLYSLEFSSDGEDWTILKDGSRIVQAS